MIIRNYSELQSGYVLTVLHIQAGTHTHSRVEVVKPTVAKETMQRWIAAWMKAELTRFVNQREKALGIVGLGLQCQWMVDCVREKILKTANYYKLCENIDTHQHILRQLLPSNSSPHRSWISIIEEIIHHAHHHLHQKSDRQVS
jgi:hypothetical protein